MGFQKFLITKIEIQAFKKIRDLVVEPREGLNLFLGSFRCGKTSVCEFVQFMLYGAEAVSLARGGAEEATGKLSVLAEGKEFLIQRSVIGGKESVSFLSLDSGKAVSTELTPGEFLTGLDRETFDQIHYFRQAQYDLPKVKPNFSILNRIASLSPDTENVYRDALSLEKKKRLYCNEEKSGTLDLLLAEEARIKKEIEELPEWEKKIAEDTASLSEINEKIDENDRRCVLIKADMAAFTDDLKLSRNKENAEELHREILAKEKELRIANYDVTNKIGKLTEEELNLLREDYNRLSLSVTRLNEARLALSSAEDNLHYHEKLFEGEATLSHLEEEMHRIKTKKLSRLLLRIFGILLFGGAVALFTVLNFMEFDLLISLCSAGAMVLGGVAACALSTLFTSSIKAIARSNGSEDAAEFFALYEKVLAHSKTTDVYREKIHSAEIKCNQRSAEKDEAQAVIAEKVGKMGYGQIPGDVLAICDEIIEANDTVYDLEHEIFELKERYRKMLSEDVEKETLTVSTEFLNLQKELSFLSVQNESLYKKRALLSESILQAKEKTAKSPEEYERELSALCARLTKEKEDYAVLDLNETLSRARKEKFESDLKAALTLKINQMLGFFLGEGESLLFDEEFELCFCDQKSVLALGSAGGGGLLQMGVLAFRIALSQMLGSNSLPMIFDDSFSILSASDAARFCSNLSEICSQYFVATSSEELSVLCRDSANVISI